MRVTNTYYWHAFKPSLVAVVSNLFQTQPLFLSGVNHVLCNQSFFWKVPFSYNGKSSVGQTFQNKSVFVICQV